LWIWQPTSKWPSRSSPVEAIEWKRKMARPQKSGGSGGVLDLAAVVELERD
jgi:hypothetical protein